MEEICQISFGQIVERQFSPEKGSGEVFELLEKSNWNTQHIHTRLLHATAYSHVTIDVHI